MSETEPDSIDAPVAPPPSTPPDTQAVLANSLRAYGTKALVVLFVLNAIHEFDRAVLAISRDRIRDSFGLSDAEPDPNETP